MKILYLITKSEVGGAQTYVYQVAKFLNLNNNEVAVASCGGDWLERELHKIKVTFFNNPFLSNSINPISVIKSYLRLKQIVREYNPDVVHCNSSVAGFLGRMAIRNKIPTVFTAHGWGFNIGVPSWQKITAIIFEKIASIYCDQIICVSQFVKSLGLKYKIGPKDKFIVIYNGIEIGNKVVFNSNAKKVKLIFIGRLAEPKQPILLLRAIQNLPESKRDMFEVVIIGDGPQKKELLRYIKAHGLNNIELMGSLPREEVLEKLKQANLLVFLSRYEGFPYVILEAMSFGIPVICSDVGGIKEIVDDNCGFVLSQDQSLNDILLNIANQHSLINKKSDRAYEKIKKDFTLDSMMRKTYEVYLNVIRFHRK